MAALLPVVVAAAVVFMHRRLSAWLCGKDWVGKGQERRKEGKRVGIGRNGTLVELIQK